MARNVQLQVVRGIKAHIPALAVGELYLATDTFDVFVGTSSGNLPIGHSVYNAAGVKQSSPHVVVDTVTLSGAGTATVTLVDGAAFTSATSYICLADDITAKNRSPQITQTSGTSITFTGNAGDVVHFICIGS